MQDNQELLLELERIEDELTCSIDESSMSEFVEAEVSLGCGGCLGTQISC